MKRVTLRFKKPNGLKTYLFLDYYPPILDPKTNKRKRQEYLGMYIYTCPENDGQEFLKYFKEKADGKPDIWDQTYELFYEFTKGRCGFIEIDAEKCGRFYIYMIQGRRAKNLPLDEAEMHYDCFKSLLRLAYKEGKLCEYTYEELHTYNILEEGGL